MATARAAALDNQDPLGWARETYRIEVGGPVYLDGNSLGRPARAVEEAIQAAIDEWRVRLVGGWEEWIDLPAAIGDRLGALLGAAAGQVLVCDSTTVNIYKLVAAALEASPGRNVIVGSSDDFPTDRYVLQGLARATGRNLRLIPTAGRGSTRGDGADPDAMGAEGEIEGAIDGDTALVCLSHVDYRTGRRLDAARISAAARRAGALMMWDLAHSAGVAPVDLDGWGADLAVGCTYKYLNAGPGAPGFLYVRADLQDRLRQPIWGWFGQADQFRMADPYEPAAGVSSFLTGTPGIIGLRAVQAAVGGVEEANRRAGNGAIWAKSQQMTALLTDLIDAELVPLGASLASPRGPHRRGGHVSVRHPRAWPWCRALIERNLVVGDFRAPDVIRLGPAPLYTTYTECVDAVTAMAAVLGGGIPDHPASHRVT